MATEEIKERINKVLANIPDEVLEDVLDYLKSLMNKSRDKVLLSSNLRKILKEDKNLLERLAQ